MAKYQSKDELVLPNRGFRVWRYSPTHDQLLLVSPADSSRGHDNRIDLLFRNVSYISLPIGFFEISLHRAGQEEAEKLVSSTSLEMNELARGRKLNVYTLNPAGSWFIVSSRPSWVETKKAYDEESVFFEAKSIDEGLTVWTLD